MTIHIYRRNSSTSARELAEALNGVRWRRAAPRQPLVAGDVVVCWGEAAPQVPAGVRILNGAPIQRKFTDAVRLRERGIRTIEVSRTRPAATPAVPLLDPAIALWETAQDLAGDFTEIENFARTPVMVQGLQELTTSLSQLRDALSRPIPLAPPVAATNWLPRSNSHVGGNDLLNPPATPDYFSRRENLTREYRVHSFAGRSIRAGQKALREGYAFTAVGVGMQTASPWIRSFDGGWRIVYDNFESNRALRELAASAVEALRLDFGAVDIGQREDGALIVLEVNRAPGLEGGSVVSYAAAINRWIEEGSRAVAAA